MGPRKRVDLAKGQVGALNLDLSNNGWGIIRMPQLGEMKNHPREALKPY